MFISWTAGQDRSAKRSPPFSLSFQRPSDQLHRPLGPVEIRHHPSRSARSHGQSGGVRRPLLRFDAEGCRCFLGNGQGALHTRPDRKFRVCRSVSPSPSRESFIQDWADSPPVAGIANGTNLLTLGLPPSRPGSPRTTGPHSKRSISSRRSRRTTFSERSGTESGSQRCWLCSSAWFESARDRRRVCGRVRLVGWRSTFEGWWRACVRLERHSRRVRVPEILPVGSELVSDPERFHRVGNTWTRCVRPQDAVQDGYPPFSRSR